MSEMVERVALAIYAELDKDEFVGGYETRSREQAGTRLDGNFDLLAVARAAIQAMREPTEAMLRALAAQYDLETISPAEEWRAMIDAALKD